MTVLVTGANGFVGRALCAALRDAGRRVRGIVRLPAGNAAVYGCDEIIAGDICDGLDWSRALKGIDSVVHLAGRAHVTRDSTPDPLAAYRRVNVDATRRLARAAADCGVRRCVFLSSIKVNGEKTTGRAFSASDAPCPEDHYAISKREAEETLWRTSQESGLEIVVLRPALVYGPGVKGNFLKLMNVIARGWPLPLGSIDNRRSLVYVGNLADAIILSLEHPAAAGKTYLLADDEGISTPDLIRSTARALGKPPRLLPFAPALLKLAGMVTGQSGAVSRLVGSLQVDSSRIRRELEWRPRCDLACGLRETARWYYQRPKVDANN